MNFVFVLWVFCTSIWNIVTFLAVLLHFMNFCKENRLIWICWKQSFSVNSINMFSMLESVWCTIILNKSINLSRILNLHNQNIKRRKKSEWIKLYRNKLTRCFGKYNGNFFENKAGMMVNDLNWVWRKTERQEGKNPQINKKKETFKRNEQKQMKKKYTQMTIVNGCNFSGAFSNKINTSSERIYTLKNT